jgi:hypothetical protein
VQVYPTAAPVNKPVPLFELVADFARRRVHLGDRVTAALAAILPWRRSLRDRLRRTWKHNPNYTSGPHSTERGQRESELRDDLALLHRTRHFRETQRLPPRLRASAAALLDQVSRLLAGTGWAKPRNIIDARTGEARETIYLPEDTWAAQTALNYAVTFLARLLAAVPRTTERATPAYRPGETKTGPERGRSSARKEEWLLRAERRWCGQPGAQPELPAQS